MYEKRQLLCFILEESKCFGYDSDIDYDSEESDGEPKLVLLEEVRRGDIN